MLSNRGVDLAVVEVLRYPKLTDAYHVNLSIVGSLDCGRERERVLY
jgi:hypothetical protein